MDHFYEMKNRHEDTNIEKLEFKIEKFNDWIKIQRKKRDKIMAEKNGLQKHEEFMLKCQEQMYENG